VTALALVTALLVAGDQTRLQPWVYQYVVMLLVAARAGGDETPEARASRLDALRVMLAAIYFWSGVQKANVVFLADTFPWLVEPIVRHLPASARPVLQAGGYVVPVVEVFIGIGLLVPRLRAAALLLGTAMHLFILYALGPLGHGVNSVVWPWNLAMIGLLFLLFGDRERVAFGRLWACRPALVRRAALLAFGVLPALNFVGLWHNHLSWGLYSGVFTDAAVHIDRAALSCLPPEVRRHVDTNRRTPVLPVFDWGLEVLNVPPHPHRWVYRRLRDRLCACDPDGRLISFVIYDPARWRPTALETYPCGEAW
jgi:hypothetical protein